MLRAGERARLTASVVQLHWEAALDLLWDGVVAAALRPAPRPDPTVDPARLDELRRAAGAALRAAAARGEAALVQATTALIAAGRTWPPGITPRDAARRCMMTGPGRWRRQPCPSP